MAKRLVIDDRWGQLGGATGGRGSTKRRIGSTMVLAQGRVIALDPYSCHDRKRYH